MRGAFAVSVRTDGPSGGSIGEYTNGTRAVRGVFADACSNPDRGDIGMRTRSTLLATLVLGAMSVAQAQEGPGIDAGGPQLERGGGEMPGSGGSAGGAERAMPEGGDDGLPGAPEPAERAQRAVEREAASERRSSPPERNVDREEGDSPRGERSAKDRGDDSDQAKRPRAAERPARAEDKQERAAEQDNRKDGDAARDEATKADAPKSDRAENRNAGEREKGASSAHKSAEARQIDLSEDKRGRVRDALRDKGDVKRQRDVDVNISVGRRLPRGWGYAPVPVAVVEIVPEYRDYVYVYVEDEYVICDPETYEVVAVIPAGVGGGVRHAGGSGTETCSAQIRLSDDEEALILDTVRLDDEVEVTDLKVGWSVPGDVELHRFPDRVLAEADELSACRYFVGEDQLAIVDPDADKVVLVIEKS